MPEATLVATSVDEAMWAVGVARGIGVAGNRDIAARGAGLGGKTLTADWSAAANSGSVMPP